MTETKRTVIEISGGDADGRAYDSASADPIEKQMVESLLHMTRNGVEGKAFHGFSIAYIEAQARGEPYGTLKPAANGTHKYTVRERYEDDDGVLVRLQYSVEP